MITDKLAELIKTLLCQQPNRATHTPTHHRTECIPLSIMDSG